MQNTEHLTAHEREHKPTPHQAGREASLTKMAVEQLAHKCLERFGRIERHLTVKKREAIRAKLEREKQLLLAMIETEQKIQKAQQTTALILNKAFFRHTIIDTSLLE